MLIKFLLLVLLAFIIAAILLFVIAYVFFKEEKRFPVAYHTTDGAILKKDSDNKIYVLLIQKHAFVNTNFWQFPGGFLDPTDNSAEDGVMREMREETGLEIGDPRYITSMKIDDERYRKKEDKIITSFFALTYVFGAVGKGFDDAAKTEWFDIEKVNVETQIRDIHRPLFYKLNQYLNKPL